MALDVVFAPEAEDDLISLYDYIAVAARADRAFSYVERIRQYCLGFWVFPEQGTRRDDLRTGLRLVGFERRVHVAFHMTQKYIVIDCILSMNGRSASDSCLPSHFKCPSCSGVIILGVA